jgi:glutathione S-transferase
MGAASKLLETLPESYGYVILVAVDSVFVNMWLAHNVGKARKKYGIEYPKMYSPDNDNFNCVQRAHQNWLESYPQFLALLFVGGLHLPKTTAAAGVVYLLGRIAYAQGYYTGDPKKRQRGFFGMLGLVTMLGTTVCTAFHQLHWTPRELKWFN